MARRPWSGFRPHRSLAPKTRDPDRRRQGLEGISVRCFRQRQRNLRSDQKLDRRYRAGILDQGFMVTELAFGATAGERSPDVPRAHKGSSVDAANTLTERLDSGRAPIADRDLYRLSTNLRRTRIIAQRPVIESIDAPAGALGGA